MEIPDRIARTWLLLSFRYCLNRRTGIAAECVRYLLEYWDVLGSYQRQVQFDIRHAIEAGWAGEVDDVEEWEKVLKLKVKEN